MFPEFVYSRGMQLILALVACSANFIIMYCISNLLLQLFGEKATFKQKALFAFLAGSVLQMLPAYIVYFINGMHLSKLPYLLTASPSPITAIIYYLLAIKILRLSAVRSIEIVGHAYLYFTLVNSIQRLISASFFQQTTEQYNYLLDTERHLLNLLIFCVIFFFTWKYLKNEPVVLSANTHIFANPKKDMFEFILKTLVLYVIVVAVPMVVEADIAANLIIVALLLMLFISTISLTFYRYIKANIQNKEMHIYSLMKSNDEFRAVKHDFLNILQTYSGYFSLQDYEGCKKYHESLVQVTVQSGYILDFSQQMEENPALISLLIDKYSRAQELNANMGISLKCSVANLPIAEIDINRVISCLLDNAIEAALGTDLKRVSFTIEQKTATSRLIIITNSAAETLDVAEMLVPGFTTKEGHQGIGLNSVRKIIDKYGNCTFQINHFNHKVTAYIEMKNDKE